MTEVARKNRFLSRIEFREDALKVVRTCSTWLFVIAGIQALLGYVFAPALLLDAAALLGLGFILRRWHSRLAAILLLLLGLSGAVLTVLNGGRTLVLVIITLVVTARAVEATFVLHGRLAARPTGGVITS